MTNAEKDQIIKSILDEVKSKGCARVGHHADQVLQRIENKPTPYHIKSKIEALITSSGKYKSRKHPNFKNDFEILINPKTWRERHPLLNDIRTGSITAIFSLLVGWLLFDLSNHEEEKKELQLQRKIDSLSHSLINIQDSFSGLKTMMKDYDRTHSITDSNTNSKKYK